MKAFYEFPLRLQSFIAKSTTFSRRKAEEAILEGRVEVNDNVVKELGLKVNKNDVVYLDGERLALYNSANVYMLNKPRGAVTSDYDPHQNKYAKDYIHTSDHDMLFAIGRLDKESQGLLLFTNDGALANKIIHPSSQILKTYTVRVKQKINSQHLDKMLDGIMLQDAKTPYKIVKYSIMTSHWVEVILSDGKNREIRKLFEYFGYEIENLVRLKIGALDIGELKPGEYKKLNGEEIKKIFQPI